MGEMLRATSELCNTCKYHMYFDGRIACDYACVERHMRKCPRGMCDKYVKQECTEARHKLGPMKVKNK